MYTELVTDKQTDRQTDGDAASVGVHVTIIKSREASCVKLAQSRYVAYSTIRSHQ